MEWQNIVDNSTKNGFIFVVILALILWTIARLEGNQTDASFILSGALAVYFGSVVYYKYIKK